jgi:hypothetical protein
MQYQLENMLHSDSYKVSSAQFATCNSRFLSASPPKLVFLRPTQSLGFISRYVHIVHLILLTHHLPPPVPHPNKLAPPLVTASISSSLHPVFLNRFGS